MKMSNFRVCYIDVYRLYSKDIVQDLVQEGKKMYVTIDEVGWDALILMGLCF